MTHHAHYQRPMNLHRPRHNPPSMRTKIATAQTNSTQHRKVEVTLHKPEWERNTSDDNTDRLTAEHICGSAR
jgi:hypothetical protein